jgi:4'-phosphopantetheinyl transferase EntD
VIARLLPDSARGAETFAPDWPSETLAAEMELVQDAVEKRRREFAAGRACAHAALAQLGLAQGPVLRGPNREPLWPPGVVGSITHTRDYCAAAVADAAVLLGLGIDAEVNAVLADGVYARISTPEDRSNPLSIPGVHLPALLFSAKEAVFKAWYPLARTWLGYQDAAISFDVPNGAFTVHLLPSAPRDALPSPVVFSGRFAASERHVFTVVTATPK